MITRDMTIEEVLNRYPNKSQRLAQEMANAGLHCVGCSAATWETIHEGMQSHGMGDDAIIGLLQKLNQILEEQEDLATISMTERAAKKYQQILIEEGKLGWGLRFGEKTAGCKGFEYFLDFAEQPQPDDIIFQSHGVAIYIAHASIDRLMGSVIDYVEGLNNSGFKISNPHIRSSCGCGNSHGY